MGGKRKQQHQQQPLVLWTGRPFLILPSPRSLCPRVLGTDRRARSRHHYSHTHSPLLIPAMHATHTHTHKHRDVGQWKRTRLAISRRPAFIRPPPSSQQPARKAPVIMTITFKKHWGRFMPTPLQPLALPTTPTTCLACLGGLRGVSRRRTFSVLSILVISDSI